MGGPWSEELARLVVAVERLSDAFSNETGTLFGKGRASPH